MDTTGCECRWVVRKTRPSPSHGGNTGSNPGCATSRQTIHRRENCSSAGSPCNATLTVTGGGNKKRACSSCDCCSKSFASAQPPASRGDGNDRVAKIVNRAVIPIVRRGGRNVERDRPGGDVVFDHASARGKENLKGMLSRGIDLERVGASATESTLG